MMLAQTDQTKVGQIRRPIRMALGQCCHSTTVLIQRKFQLDQTCIDETHHRICRADMEGSFG